MPFFFFNLPFNVDLKFKNLKNLNEHEFQHSSSSGAVLVLNANIRAFNSHAKAVRLHNSDLIAYPFTWSFFS